MPALRATAELLATVRRLTRRPFSGSFSGTKLTSYDVRHWSAREAEPHNGSKYTDQVLDSLYVIETVAKHFFIRAEMGKNAGRKQSEVGEDYGKRHIWRTGYHIGTRGCQP